MIQMIISNNDNPQSGVSTNQTRGGVTQADKTVFVATGRLATPQVTVALIHMIIPIIIHHPNDHPYDLLQLLRELPVVHQSQSEFTSKHR